MTITITLEEFQALALARENGRSLSAEIMYRVRQTMKNECVVA